MRATAAAARAAMRSVRSSPVGVRVASVNFTLAVSTCRRAISCGAVRVCSSSTVPARRLRAAAMSASISSTDFGAVCSVMVASSGRRVGGRSARGRGWSVDAEVASQLGHVAGRLDVVLGVRDGPGLVDHEGAADDALDGLAVELLLAVGAVALHHRLVRVGQQRDGEADLLAELRELLRLVRGDAEYLVAVPAEAGD